MRCRCGCCHRDAQRSADQAGGQLRLQGALALNGGRGWVGPAALTGPPPLGWRPPIPGQRFLRDGHQTVLEDHSRLHYEPHELRVFEKIGACWAGDPPSARCRLPAAGSDGRAAWWAGAMPPRQRASGRCSSPTWRWTPCSATTSRPPTATLKSWPRSWCRATSPASARPSTSYVCPRRPGAMVWPTRPSLCDLSGSGLAASCRSSTTCPRTASMRKRPPSTARSGTTCAPGAAG